MLYLDRETGGKPVPRNFSPTPQHPSRSFRTIDPLANKTRPFLISTSRWETRKLSVTWLGTPPRVLRIPTLRPRLRRISRVAAWRDLAGTRTQRPAASSTTDATPNLGLQRLSALPERCSVRRRWSVIFGITSTAQRKCLQCMKKQQRNQLTNYIIHDIDIVDWCGWWDANERKNSRCGSLRYLKINCHANRNEGIFDSLWFTWTTYQLQINFCCAKINKQEIETKLSRSLLTFLELGNLSRNRAFTASSFKYCN